MRAARFALLAVLAVSFLGLASACGCANCCNWWQSGRRTCYKTYEFWQDGPRRFLNATAQAQMTRMVPVINTVYQNEMGLKGCTFLRYSALSGCSQVHKKRQRQWTWQWTSWTFTYDTAWWCPIGTGNPQCPCPTTCERCFENYPNGRCPCFSGHFEYITIVARMDLWGSGLMKDLELIDYWDCGEW